MSGEVDEGFESARRDFQKAWVSDGSHPINESSEVQRIILSVGPHKDELRAVATQYEKIAAALATAQRSCDGVIAALETQLRATDDAIDAVKTNTMLTRQAAESTIAQLKAAAVADTKSALSQAQGVRTTYTGVLSAATAALKPTKAGLPTDLKTDVSDAISSGKLPDDPKKFREIWDQLTPAEKDEFYNRDHSIGNHPGMPCDPPDHLGYDHYNKLNLADQLNHAQAAAAQADALKNQHPDWAAGENIPHPNEPGAIFADRQAYEAWQRQYDAARDGAKYLPDLQAVDKAVSMSPDRKLMLLDTQTGKQVRAAIAVGDPDTATHVSVTAPGLNTTVHGAIGGMTDEAQNVRKEAINQLRLAGSSDTVAAVAWIGYDPPQVPGFDDIGGSLTGGWGVSHDDIAKAGAHDLARFYDGIQASHVGGPADLTVIGHSYGSLTTGLALQEPGDHGVSRALFYGSPGIEATTPQQLGLQNGHVFTMETPDDPIQKVYDLPPIAHEVVPFLPPGLREIATGALGVGDITGAGQFGPNPATNPNFAHLATGQTTVPDGRTFGAASGHSDYPRWDSGRDQLYTSGYNIAAVIAGTAPVEQK